MNSAVAALLLRLCERPHFRFSLRVLQRAKFDRHSTSNSRRLACVLKAGEVRAVAPGERTAQPFAGRKRWTGRFRSHARKQLHHFIDIPHMIGNASLHGWSRFQRGGHASLGRHELFTVFRVRQFDITGRRQGSETNAFSSVDKCVKPGWRVACTTFLDQGLKAGTFTPYARR
jgi:hypothetical protein